MLTFIKEFFRVLLGYAFKKKTTITVERPQIGDKAHFPLEDIPDSVLVKFWTNIHGWNNQYVDMPKEIIQAVLLGFLVPMDINDITISKRWPEFLICTKRFHREVVGVLRYSSNMERYTAFVRGFYVQAKTYQEIMKAILHIQEADAERIKELMEKDRE